MQAMLVWLGERIMLQVVTNGCFDPVSGQHIEFLKEARSFGDHLTVLIARDWLVNKLKGEGRPLISFEERKEILSNLNCVDAVYGYIDEEELDKFYEIVKPDILVKGGEWKGSKLTGQIWCKEVKFTRFRPGHCSEYLDKYYEKRIAKERRVALKEKCEDSCSHPTILWRKND
jgi:D-beta-D-heptose 7-phosphate kinase/D-beta-D-heptose 1-phosphate adenosyltransferase